MTNKKEFHIIGKGYTINKLSEKSDKEIEDLRVIGNNFLNKSCARYISELIEKIINIPSSNTVSITLHGLKDSLKIEENDTEYKGVKELRYIIEDVSYELFLEHDGKNSIELNKTNEKNLFKKLLKK